jgi:hypothetical protein
MNYEEAITRRIRRAGVVGAANDAGGLAPASHSAPVQETVMKLSGRDLIETRAGRTPA